MKAYHYFLIYGILIFTSCKESESPKTTEETFWVWTSRIPCDFDTTIRCLYVLKENTLDYDLNNWIRLDEKYILSDFDYQSGHFYQLKVEIPEANSQNPFEYKVIDVIQKVKDFSTELNAGWDILQINSFKVPEDKFAYFKINFEGWRRIISANTECKFYSGNLGKVGESEFSVFSLSTDYFTENTECDDFGLKDAILTSKSYNLINSDSLILKDQNQKITLILKRLPGYNPYGPGKK
jgi:hypothetical protein